MLKELACFCVCVFCVYGVLGLPLGNIHTKYAYCIHTHRHHVGTRTIVQVPERRCAMVQLPQHDPCLFVCLFVYEWVSQCCVHAYD